MKIYKAFGGVAVLVSLFLAYRVVTTIHDASIFTILTSLVGLVAAVVIAAFGVKMLRLQQR